MESFRAALGTSCASAIAVINAAGELVLWELLRASYFSVVVKVHDLHCSLTMFNSRPECLLDRFLMYWTLIRLHQTLQIVS